MTCCATNAATARETAAADNTANATNNTANDAGEGLDPNQSPLVQVLQMLLAALQAMGAVGGNDNNAAGDDSNAANCDAKDHAGGCPAGGAGNADAQTGLDDLLTNLGSALDRAAA